MSIKNLKDASKKNHGYASAIQMAGTTNGLENALLQKAKRVRMSSFS